MTSPAITNSLLRLDQVTGSPLLPFKRPNDRMDFFVLELGQHKDLPRWCAHTLKTLRKHAKALRDLRAAGAEITFIGGVRFDGARIEV